MEDRYAGLTAQQQRTADYLLAHERTAFALSVSEFAEAAKVSQATVVRFAREIGFAGYHELRAALMEEARQDLTPEARFASEPLSREPAGTLARVAESELDNLQRTVAELDPRQFRRFVSRLQRAELIATMGLGVSAIMARLTQYLLFQIGVRSELLSREAVTLNEQVELLPKSSALIVFLFPPYSRQTVDAALRAKARRIPILAITDHINSPICTHAQASLCCHSNNILFTNSLSGPLVVLNAVITELALSDKGRALRHLRASERVTCDEYL